MHPLLTGYPMTICPLGPPHMHRVHALVSVVTWRSALPKMDFKVMPALGGAPCCSAAPQRWQDPQRRVFSNGSPMKIPEVIKWLRFLWVSFCSTWSRGCAAWPQDWISEPTSWGSPSEMVQIRSSTTSEIFAAIGNYLSCYVHQLVTSRPTLYPLESWDDARHFCDAERESQRNQFFVAGDVQFVMSVIHLLMCMFDIYNILQGALHGGTPKNCNLPTWNRTWFWWCLRSDDTKNIHHQTVPSISFTMVATP